MQYPAPQSSGNLALNHEAGMKGYLYAKGIAWKDYAKHVAKVS